MTLPSLPSASTRRILIVEDETDIAELIGFNLERAGFEVITAHDGIAGTEVALRERPDLIVLDLMLPGRDGYAVLRELRRDPRTVNVPVLMLTAQARTEDRIEGLQRAANMPLTFRTVELARLLRDNNPAVQGEVLKELESLLGGAEGEQFLSVFFRETAGKVQQLADFPGDIESRWLLNVAYMTLGEYPAGVPAPWRLDPALFASEFDIGRFPEVATSSWPSFRPAIVGGRWNMRPIP